MYQVGWGNYARFWDFLFGLVCVGCGDFGGFGGLTRVLRGRRGASRGSGGDMGGVEEGGSVASPAAALQPSAERKGL